MSDSKKSSASANDPDSSKDFSTTQEDILPSVNTSSQALPADMSQSLPEGSTLIHLPSESSDEEPPFNLSILRRLEEIGAYAPPQEESTYDIPSESSDNDNSSVNITTLIRKSEDDITASQEYMLDIVEPSQLDQSPWIFVCKFRPSQYLKFAIEALSNPEVCCYESGRIDIDANSFNITVLNLTNNVLGHLRLNPARFRCIKPLDGKRLSLPELSRGVADVEDEGTVYLGIQRSTDQLDIRVLPEGAKDIRRFFANLSYTTTTICKFPEVMSFFFTATVPSEDFRTMIDHLLQQPLPQQVSVDIKDNTATLRVGSDNNSWTADYGMLKDDGSCELVAGKTYSTTFEWINGGVAESLRRASELNAEFTVLFHAERPRIIILRFSLGDVGYLDFMRLSQSYIVP